MTPALSVHFFRFAVFLAYGAMAVSAAADIPLANAPLELTAINLANEIDPLMAEWIDKHKGPGAVVVVVTRDAPVFAKGYGFSDINAKKPFTADTTLVRPGSISKLFTGIAVMQLVDEGKLDLDRDVNAYLDFAVPTPDGGVPVTLRLLLTHRAGFEEHVKGVLSKDREPEPLGRWLTKHLPLRLFPQGDVPAYSNYGIGLAGYIVERVSGEPYVDYIQRHILEPLGMSHSTFQQPLPDALSPLMANGYHTSDKPPLGFFETIADSPAGALSATGADMGRFLRALLNGGMLDRVRILPKARLNEMMAPSTATAGDFLGLVFHGKKVASHEAIWHNGGTLTFYSDLTVFPEQSVGVFVSFNGTGESEEGAALPDPARMIAERFLPNAPGKAAPSAALSSDPGMPGVYHGSRRAESSFLRLNDLAEQSFLTVDSAGSARLFSALWPFGEGMAVTRLGQNLYEFPEGSRFTFEATPDSDAYFAWATLHLQRVPWFLDVRWIAPACVASTAVVLLTLLAWPVGAFWRHAHNRAWGQEDGARHKYLAVRLVLLVDATVLVATAGCLYAMGTDLTLFNDALDPLVFVLYALAWFGVFGALLTLWAAMQFWRDGIGSWWSRVHHSLIAASSVLLAWFFITFRLAGTTLNY